MFSKPLPAVGQISRRKSQSGVPSQGSQTAQEILCKEVHFGYQQFTFITFGVTACQTSVPRITVGALCFPERSVPYHDVFVLYPSRFLSYTHQVFFLCPAPIKISALHLSRFLYPLTAPYQGFSRAYQGCLRAPTQEMSFVSLFTSLCGSSRYYILRQE